LSVSTGSCRGRLPVIEFELFRKIANFGEKLTAFATILDGAAKLHAALVFLLTTGFDGAVAFFVGQGHFQDSQGEYGSFKIGTGDDGLAAWGLQADECCGEFNNAFAIRLAPTGYVAWADSMQH
jgi:hypothetical protein